jgi:hypothetical protein
VKKHSKKICVVSDKYYAMPCQNIKTLQINKHAVSEPKRLYGTEQLPPYKQTEENVKGFLSLMHAA